LEKGELKGDSQSHSLSSKKAITQSSSAELSNSNT